MHGGDEALAPPAAPQVGVGRGQEVGPRHRAEQAAERAGQQQGPGTRVDSLARHVDQRHLERLAVGVGDDEVAAERRAPGGAQHHVRAPALPQRGELALLPDPVAQLDQHLVAAQALEPELRPGPREHVGERRRHHDRGDDAGPGPVFGDVVRDDRGGDHEQHPQRPDPEQQAARQDRQDDHAGREPPLRQVHGGHADGYDRHREHEGHPPVTRDELPAQPGTQLLPAGPEAAGQRAAGNVPGGKP